LQGRGKGDFYVRLIVDIPEKLTREQKKLIEKLADSML
jgi:DnaJ-class molecular chaperone